MATIRTSNNPAMLIWAREEMGLSIEDAADLLSISADSLHSAEAGEKPLTLIQLRKAADKYNCPIGYFYLSKPPHKSEFKPVPDYRVAPEYSGISDPRLNREISKVRNFRDIYIEIAQSLEKPLKNFLVETNDVLEGIGTRIRERLAVDQNEIEALDYDEAYKYWKSKIEEDGVLVYESQYIPKSTGVIGIALSYDQFPVILIRRGSFSNERKLFTLLHEYAHVLFGVSALNDSLSMISFAAANNESIRIEAKCNRIASEILIPTESIDPGDYAGLTPPEQMEVMSRKYKVTYTTAAVCLRKHEFITQNEYDKLVAAQREAFVEKKAVEKARGVEGGPPREYIQRLDLGRPLFEAVLQAYSTGILDVFDASKILRLKVGKVDQLVAG